ncbi:MAG: hypothetical protein DRI34_13945, partial [Deltaproteobacteria bacterium]
MRLLVTATIFSLFFMPLPLRAQSGKTSQVKGKGARQEAVLRREGKLKKDASLREVIRDYQKLVRENRGDSEATFTLALAYHSLGDFKQAEKYYRRTIKIDPAEVDARLNLGALIQRQGRYAEAVKWYKET